MVLSPTSLEGLEGSLVSCLFLDFSLSRFLYIRKSPVVLNTLWSHSFSPIFLLLVWQCLHFNWKEKYPLLNFLSLWWIIRAILKKFVIAVKVENSFNSPSYKMIFYFVYIGSWKYSDGSLLLFSKWHWMLLNLIHFNVLFQCSAYLLCISQVYIKTATVYYIVSANFAHLINIEYKSPYGYGLTFVEVALRWQC